MFKGFYPGIIMRLSTLQKYILREMYTAKSKIFLRRRFNRFYDRTADRPSDDTIVKDLGKSLDRLIDKGLMVGYGIRTPQKWYIKEVKLLPAGRVLAKKLLGEQMLLPFRSHKA